MELTSKQLQKLLDNIKRDPATKRAPAQTVVNSLKKEQMAQGRGQ